MLSGLQEKQQDVQHAIEKHLTGLKRHFKQCLEAVISLPYGLNVPELFLAPAVVRGGSSPEMRRAEAHTKSY